MAKLPKGWNKLSNQEQRAWVAANIKHLEAELAAMLRISRTLQSGKVHAADWSEERPDLAILKDA